MLFSLHTANKIFLIKNPRIQDIEEGVLTKAHSGLHCTVTPLVPKESSVFEKKVLLLKMIQDLIVEEDIRDYTISTFTCRAVPYIRHLSPVDIEYFQNDLEAVIHPELFLEMNEYAGEDPAQDEPELLYHRSLVPQYSRKTADHRARE
jgi:hypothetical protein